MNCIQERLAKYRVATYCIVTFALTWAFWFAAVYPRALPLMEAGKSIFSDSLTVMLVGAGMFFPALGVVVTRLITGEGFHNVWIKPVQFRRTWKYYMAGWLGPIALVAVGGAAYFVLNPSQFDPSMPLFVEATQQQLEASGQAASLDAAQIRMLGYAQLALVLVAPLLNCITCFGEEWGWRGYLVPKVSTHLRIVPTLLITGVIWGLWHAPLTVIGHNYGTGYPTWPLGGIAAMCLFCVVVGIFLTYVTVRTGSCLAAAIGHGAINGFVSAALLFSVTGGNPFVGPLPVGVVGGSAFIVVAAFMLRDLHRREKAGTLDMPKAGLPDDVTKTDLTRAPKE